MFNATFMGLDVHARTVTAALNAATAELIEAKTTADPTPAMVGGTNVC